MARHPAWIVFALPALAGCEALAPPPPPAILLPAPDEEENWRAVASAEHAEAIDGLAERWSGALERARTAGFSSAIAVEGPLLLADAALPRAALPPGSYRCRILRFSERPAFTAYRRFFCHVGAEGRLDSVTKQTGTERPGGYLWPDADERRIFLGAMALGDEEVPPAYGDDAERDLAGIVERVERFQWRLVLPRGEGLDVIELIPIVPAAD